MKELIARVVGGSDLSAEEITQAMDAILGGAAIPTQIAALLVALRIKGETAAELAAAARAMRRHALPVKVASPPPLLDTCGTGGDGSGTFNISTISAIVVAATGVKVAKHGNRAATSRTGSADLLEALGVDLNLPAEAIARSIDELGIGFMFARVHHPAMRHVGPVRAEIGVRTLFNWLGPLTNPAGVTHQLLGVGDGTKLEIMAAALCDLGIEGAWVVHGHGGLDEVSLSGPTRVARVRAAKVDSFTVNPEDFGVPPAPGGALTGGDVEQNIALCHSILDGTRGPQRDAVVINAAAALCAAGVETDPRAAAARAATAIDSGAARAKLKAWIAFGA
jgi:anthranilate phosphoribosyltransferase